MQCEQHIPTCCEVWEENGNLLCLNVSNRRFFRLSTATRSSARKLYFLCYVAAWKGVRMCGKIYDAPINASFHFDYVWHVGWNMFSSRLKNVWQIIRIWRFLEKFPRGNFFGCERRNKLVKSFLCCRKWDVIY